MAYVVTVSTAFQQQSRSITVDRGNEEFTSFPAKVGNPDYDSFLESQSLTDAEVQAMEPDVWHDMA